MNVHDDARNAEYERGENGSPPELVLEPPDHIEDLWQALHGDLWDPPLEKVWGTMLSEVRRMIESGALVDGQVPGEGEGVTDLSDSPSPGHIDGSEGWMEPVLCPVSPGLVEQLRRPSGIVTNRRARIWLDSDNVLNVREFTEAEEMSEMLWGEHSDGGESGE